MASSESQNSGNISSGNLHCLRCGYDLRGIAVDRACPECGLGIARSLNAGGELHRGRPAWLKRLGWGARLLLATQLSVLGFLAFCIHGLALFPAWFIVAVPLAFAIMHFTSLMLLTGPENRFERRQPGNRIRIALRIFSLNSLCLGVFLSMFFWEAMRWLSLWLSTFGQAVLWTGPVSRGSINPWGYAVAASALLLASCWLLTFLYLRRLALRVLDPSLAEHCAIVGCGMALAIAGPFGLALGYGMIVLDVLDMSTTVGFVWILSFEVAVFLFVIWSTWLLVLFSIAFGKAARQARRSWREADAAIAASE
jgi:hypothetical protein